METAGKEVYTVRDHRSQVTSIILKDPVASRKSAVISWMMEHEKIS